MIRTISERKSVHSVEKNLYYQYASIEKQFKKSNALMHLFCPLVHNSNVMVLSKKSAGSILGATKRLLCYHISMLNLAPVDEGRVCTYLDGYNRTMLAVSLIVTIITVFCSSHNV